MVNRTSRIETSQSLQFCRNNPELLREANLQLPGSISQSAGEVNTQPAISQVSSNQIRYSQSSINQQNSSGLEGARRYAYQSPVVENARSTLAGHGPQQGTDSSFGFYPPNFGYQWPYPPMFPQPGYYPPMPYGPAYGQPAFPLDFRNSSQNDPRYTSFPHPSGIDMSRRSSSLDTTFQRETRTCNLLQKWQVSFSGGYKEDVEEFIERIKECQRSLNVTDGEILRLIPSILSGAARFWARPLSQNWNSITDFFAALRLQYGVPDFQARLEEEIRARTQGPDEPISSFISNMRLLLDKVVPKMTLEAQLERTYRNLHPSLYRFIFREQFKTFEELQILGQREEVRREKEKTYRPPPAPETALFPNFAYKMKKRTKAAVINTTDGEIEHNVAAVKVVPKDYPISKRQEKTQGETAPTATPVQQNENRKESARGRQSAPARNSPTDQQRPRRRATSSDKCWVCKKEGHWDRECKERQGVLCYRCGHPGVIVATCPNCSKTPKETEGGHKTQNQSPSNSSALASVGSPIQSEKNLIKTCFTSPSPCQTAAVGHVDNRLYVNIEIHGRVFPALLDSGAIASFLGPKPAELVKSRITPCSTYMVMANGQTDKIVGEVELTFTIDGEEITSRIRVSNSLNYDIILGMDLMERLQMRINFEDRTWYTPKGIVHPCYPKNQDPSTVYAVAALDGVAELSQGERILLRVKLDPFLDNVGGATTAARITPHKIDVQGHPPVKQKMRRISPKL